MKKIIVSGIQPSGRLTLGNYLGVIKQWKELQDNPEYECRFFIADLHAMTTKSQNEINPDITDTHNYLLSNVGWKNISFQSDYADKILALFWKLACQTSIGQLTRMTQFKEKSDKGGENLGLFSYPVLMAADILALEADLVPVGEDQKQHLELARDLAKKLGLKVPEPLISKDYGRIMSLTNPLKKMSKSDPDQNGCIYLDDSADDIRRKIKKAATTPKGTNNLENIYKGCGGILSDEYGRFINWNRAAEAKEMIAEAIINELKQQ